jgi:hypothetical protein
MSDCGRKKKLKARKHRRGNDKMKTSSFLMVIGLLAAAAGPSFAFDGSVGRGVQNGVTRVSCDTRAEDDQAMCASKCEDAFLKEQMSFTANMDKIRESKKACDEKCGCPQNTK